MAHIALYNRIYQINENNWYAPMTWLTRFISVIKVDLVDTTSSAGDWCGFFIQKIGNKYHFIRFFQQNNYPNGGFTLSTDNGSFFVLNAHDYNETIRKPDFIEYIYTICISDNKYYF